MRMQLLAAVAFALVGCEAGPDDQATAAFKQGDCVQLKLDASQRGMVISRRGIAGALSVRWMKYPWTSASVYTFELDACKE